MRSRVPVFLALSLLAGCADQWTRPAATQQQIDTDLYYCQRENRNVSDGSVLGPQGDFAQESLVRQCMRARGYSLAQ